MIPYPTVVPVNEIKDVITSIQAGTMMTNKVQFVKDVWTIEGYCLYAAVGEVPAGIVASAKPFAMDDPEILEHLNSLLVPAGMQQALPPSTWMTIAKWALQVILALL